MNPIDKVIKGFSSDQGGKTGVMPKHNEDISNAEQKEKNKFMGVRI